jgi:hypothetical protein
MRFCGKKNKVEEAKLNEHQRKPKETFLGKEKKSMCGNEKKK